MPEEALLTRSSRAKKPMNACVHTYTKPQTPSTRRRGPGWQIHGSVEDTKLSTNKQHTHSLGAFVLGWPSARDHLARISRVDCEGGTSAQWGFEVPAERSRACDKRSDTAQPTLGTTILTAANAMT